MYPISRAQDCRQGTDTLCPVTTMAEPHFEPLELFDFAPSFEEEPDDGPPPAFVPDDEPMEWDIDEELAMMEQEEMGAQGDGASPPFPLDEEPDFAMEDEAMRQEANTMAKKLNANASSSMTQKDSNTSGMSFGQSDIFDAPGASCASQLQEA